LVKNKLLKNKDYNFYNIKEGDNIVKMVKKVLVAYMVCAIIVMGMGPSLSAAEITSQKISKKEISQLSKQEKKSSSETEKVVAGGDDGLVTVFAVVGVLAILAAAAAKKNTDKK